MKIKAILILTVMLSALLPSNALAIPEYYRKHIVLVVDQTQKTMAGGNLQPVASALLNFLNGSEIGNDVKKIKVPKVLSYNSDEDLLEIFLYGLEGNVMDMTTAHGHALQLKLDSRTLSNHDLFDKTLNWLVHPYKSATEFGDLSNWWNSELTDVFNLKTPLASNVGYGLSGFLPNAVIPFINKEIPAEEYYIICISTFLAGQTGNNAAGDIAILGQIYGNAQKAESFNEWLGQFASPYQVSDWINISRGNTQNNGVSAFGKQLKLEAAAGTSINIKSSIKLTQLSYSGKIFSVNPITVGFPKDEGLDISHIVLSVKNDDEIYNQEIDNYSYDEIKKEYTLNPQPIELKNGVRKDSKLEVNVVFYPKNEETTTILPFVFITDWEIDASRDIVFKPAPTWLYVGIVAFCLLMLLVLWIIYHRRATLAKNSIKLHIWPISNSRFMDVSNNKVINYDCWYFKEGRKEKNIPVSGSIKIEYPKFAAKNKLVAEYQIQDIDLNEDFSFRPDGRMPNGEVRCANQWYPLKVYQNGDFEFEVVSYLESVLSAPDFTRNDLNILRLKVMVRTHFEDSKGRVVGDYTQTEKKYHFIVRPVIENSDIWISVDPGTSGSCIAYGWGGLPADTNNIHLASSLSTDTANRIIKSPIFHSKISILDHSDLFNGKSPEELMVFDSESGTGDFRFGNEAHIYWGRNSFQSIKKLLGYTNELDVKNDKGKMTKIKGEDLAYLVIKGLCYEFEKYLKEDESVAPYIREHLLKKGHLDPSRAIVAVPNNYTVNKVQSMINSIKRTHLFKEVHYVYEAEGVMMYYMNMNWSRLTSLANKTFVVFDMGGATINATAFRLDVNTGIKDGSVFTRSIIVDTVSRIGYTVGGDNIDFALINIVLQIPSIAKALNDSHVSQEDFMRQHKKRLISFAQKLKIDYIESLDGNIREGNIAKDEYAFWTEAYKMFSVDCNLVSCPDKMDERDLKFLKSGNAKLVMAKMVHNCVEDAIKELITDKFSSSIELILSGRSVLYPGIRDKVISTLKSSGYSVDEWDYNGIKSREEIVKTAVVKGACWYAMNSKYVQLRHDSVTSTFGYTDMVNQKVKFIPIIDRNKKFDENGEIERSVQPKDPTITTIKFVQMLGSNFDEIYQSKELLHKMAELTQVSQTKITGNVKKIKIKVDSNNNFSYEITVTGEPEPIRGTCVASDSDITDRNSEAYAFAALSSLEDMFTAEVTESSTVKPQKPSRF